MANSKDKALYTTIHTYHYDLIKMEEIDIIQAVILSDVEYFVHRQLDYYKSNDLLAIQLGISERSIKRKIADLVEKEYISIRKSYRKRYIELTKKYTDFVKGQIGTLEQVKGQNVQEKGQNVLSVKGQIGTFHNKNNNILRTTIEQYTSELREIFKSYYSNISIRFNKTQVENKLKVKLKKHDFEIIKNGFINYLDYNKKSEHDIQYIKSTHLFIQNEMYLDYQEALENVQISYGKKTISSSVGIYATEIPPLDPRLEYLLKKILTDELTEEEQREYEELKKNESEEN